MNDAPRSGTHVGYRVDRLSRDNNLMKGGVRGGAI